MNVATNIEATTKPSAMPHQLSSARSESHSSISFIDSLSEAANNAASQPPTKQANQAEAQDLDKSAVKSSDAKSSKDSNNVRRKKSDDADSQDAQPATDNDNLQAQVVIVPQVQPLPAPQRYTLDAQPLTGSANISADATQSTNADFNLANNQATVAAQPVQLKSDYANEDVDADQDAVPVMGDVQTSASTEGALNAKPAEQAADATPVEVAAQPAAPSTDATIAAPVAAQPTADQLAIQNPTDQNATAAQVNAVASNQATAAPQVKTSTTHAFEQLQAASASKAQSTANFASKLNAKTPAKDSANTKSNDGTKLADQDSQKAADVKASSDQQNSQGDAQQDQNQAPVQVNFAAHTATAQANHQDASAAIAMQAAPAARNITSEQASAAPERVVAQPATAPEVQPTINTAKLIQSIGQTEMRVGMRSAEFGDISIRTAATQNSLTAQISLDHSELAKTLTAHLPEMHAKLGGDQNVNVRIDTNGQSSSFDGASSSSSDARGNARQQAQNGSFNTSRFFNAEQSQVSPVVTAASNSYNTAGRLDIRA